MNIELKPIAESKVRQLGGDVCGVLVRTEGSQVMAVSEHGRCTRLDAGVTGPVEPSGMSERELFEQRFPAPAGIYWNEISEQYDALPGAAGFDDAEIYHGRWEAWQAARAVSGQGAEPDWSDSKTLETEGWKNPLLSKNDRLQIADGAVAWRAEVIKSLRSRDRQPAQQGSVPDGFSEFVSAVRSINRSSHHAIQIPGDDQPCFWQRKEWIDWILELADQVEDSLSAATPQPQGDGWIAVPRGAVEYLKDQWPGAYARFYEKVDELKRTQPPVEQEGKGNEY